MEDAWPGKPVIREHRETGPGLTTLLAASAEKPPPSCGYPVTELHERVAVGRHGVVPEVAGDHLLEPFSLLGNRLVHALSQFLFDRLELCPHAVAPGLPFDQEATPAGFAADLGRTCTDRSRQLCLAPSSIRATLAQKSDLSARGTPISLSLWNPNVFSAQTTSGHSRRSRK
jgi:hypothetical protein